MFWGKKKEPSEPSKILYMLNAYLSGAPGMSSRDKTLHRLGFQVHILGMTCTAMKATFSSPDQLNPVRIYEELLTEHDLLPSMPIKDFVDGILAASLNNEDIAEALETGGESFQRYIVESDPMAPFELIGSGKFAENHASSFSQFVSE